jgi:hypothetical protein
MLVNNLLQILVDGMVEETLEEMEKVVVVLLTFEWEVMD